MTILVWYFKMFLAGSRGGETGKERKDEDQTIFIPQRPPNPSSLMNISRYSTFPTNKTNNTKWLSSHSLHWWALPVAPALLRTAAKRYGFSSTPPSLILVLLLSCFFKGKKKLTYTKKWKEKIRAAFQQQQDFFITGNCTKTVLILHKPDGFCLLFEAESAFMNDITKPPPSKILWCWDLAASTPRCWALHQITFKCLLQSSISVSRGQPW